ncbi:hypothetical protein niasHS_005432 [Heterodera schachtii]|uniref:B30.2/SPRY domain-containing protein n=1 Tax=Heterodera schachtii TaxID=97005 RepID=A0ABD2JIX8_HETSC
MQRRINDECEQTRKKKVTFRETVEEINGTTTEIVHMETLSHAASIARNCFVHSKFGGTNPRRPWHYSSANSEHGEASVAIHQLQQATQQLQQQTRESDAKFEYLCREIKRKVENLQLLHIGTTLQIKHILRRIAELERMQALVSSRSSFEFIRNTNYASTTPFTDVRKNDNYQNVCRNRNAFRFTPSPITCDQRVQRKDGLFAAIHLKNCWDKYACHNGLKIRGTECLKVQKTDQSLGWSSVFATCSVPAESAGGIFYFEVRIFHVLSCFTIGLATKQMPLAPQLAVPAHSSAASAPGGTAHLFGGNDHFLLMISMTSKTNQQKQQHGSSSSTTKSTTITEFFCGDIVGFGIELANRRIIVTKNGRRLVIADLFFSAAQPLFPFVSLKDFGATIEANFGPNFKFIP